MRNAMLPWDEVVRLSENGRVMKLVRFDVDGQLAVEEAGVVDPAACGLNHWAQGKVRCRLLRSGTGSVLFDTNEFMHSTAAHRLLGRASRAQRMIDEVKGNSDDI